MTAKGWLRLRRRTADKVGVSLEALDFDVVSAGGKIRDEDVLALINMGATHVLVSESCISPRAIPPAST